MKGDILFTLLEYERGYRTSKKLRASVSKHEVTDIQRGYDPPSSNKRLQTFKEATSLHLQTRGWETLKRLTRFILFPVSNYGD